MFWRLNFNMADNIQTESLEKFFIDYATLMSLGLNVTAHKEKLDELVNRSVSARAEEVFDDFSANLEQSIETLDDYFLNIGKDSTKELRLELYKKDIDTENAFFTIFILYNPTTEIETTEPNGIFSVEFSSIKECHQPFILFGKKFQPSHNLLGDSTETILVRKKSETERKLKNLFFNSYTGKRVIEIYGSNYSSLIDRDYRATHKYTNEEMIQGLKETYKYYLRGALLSDGRITPGNKADRVEKFIDTIKNLPEIVTRFYEQQDAHAIEVLKRLSE